MNNGLYVIRDLEPHLPSTPMLATDIAKRVGCWAPGSIKSALNIMADQGTVKRVTLVDDVGFTRNLYWRAEG